MNRDGEFAGGVRAMRGRCSGQGSRNNFCSQVGFMRPVAPGRSWFLGFDIRSKPGVLLGFHRNNDEHIYFTRGMSGGSVNGKAQAPYLKESDSLAVHSCPSSPFILEPTLTSHEI